MSEDLVENLINVVSERRSEASRQALTWEHEVRDARSSHDVSKYGNMMDYWKDRHNVMLSIENEMREVVKAYHSKA